VDDLDLAGGTVLLHGKGGKDRVVPVGSYARDAVDAYLVRGRPALAAAGRGTPALFLNHRGGGCLAKVRGQCCGRRLLPRV